MGSKDYWPRRPRLGDDLDIRFEQLRQKFYRRLCVEQEQLALLSVDLDSMRFDAQPTCERIRLVAHRMCGAAALYGDVAICEAAGALERAATTAIRTRAADDEEHVGQTVRSLIAILSLMVGGAMPAAEVPAPDGPAPDRPVPDRRA